MIRRTQGKPTRQSTQNVSVLRLLYHLKYMQALCVYILSCTKPCHLHFSGCKNLRKRRRLKPELPQGSERVPEVTVLRSSMENLQPQRRRKLLVLGPQRRRQNYVHHQRRGKAGVPTQKGTVSLGTELGLKPNSLAISFLDFFGFALFSLAAPSTRLISLMHACITSALNKLMFLLQWVLPPWSPCRLVPFRMSGHFTLCAIFK